MQALIDQRRWVCAVPARESRNGPPGDLSGLTRCQLAYPALSRMNCSLAVSILRRLSPDSWLNRGANVRVRFETSAMIPGLVQGGFPMVTCSASIRGFLVNRCRCNAPRTSMGRPLCQETKRTKLERKRPAFQPSSTPAGVAMTRSNAAAADFPIGVDDDLNAKKGHFFNNGSRAILCGPVLLSSLVQLTPFGLIDLTTKIYGCELDVRRRTDRTEN